MNITANAANLNWRSNNHGVWKALVKDMAPNSSVTFSDGLTGTVAGRQVTVESPSMPTGFMTYTTDDNTAVFGGVLYGAGAVSDSLEAVAGDKTVRMGSVDLGTLEWTYQESSTNPGIWYFKCPYPAGIYIASVNDTSIIIVNSVYVAISPFAFSAGNIMANKTIMTFVRDRALYLRDDTYTDVDSFTAAMSGVILYYELATPTTSTETAQSLALQTGVNNLALNECDSSFTLDYTGTEFTLPLDSTHKYAFSDNGVKSMLTGSTEQAVTGGQDMLVDVTRMFNGDATAINAVTSWADMAAVMPAYLSNVAYNEGEVVGRSGGVTTAKWNQLVQNGNFADGTKGWTSSYLALSASNNKLTCIVGSAPGSALLSQTSTDTKPAGHKYCVSLYITCAKASEVICVLYSQTIAGQNNGSKSNNLTVTYEANTRTKISGILTTTALTNRFIIYPIKTNAAAFSAGDELLIENVQLIDLTEIYGAGHEPSTVEEFEADCAKWGKDLSQYQPYDAGTPMGGSATFSDLHGVGTAKDTQDVVTGAKTVKMGSVDLGTLMWSYDSTYDCFVSYTESELRVSQFLGVCSKYLFVGVYLNLADKTSAYIFNRAIAVRDSAFTDPAEFKAAMSGVMLYYELAEPTTSTETAQPLTAIKGLNNVHEQNMSITGTPLTLGYTGTDQTIPAETSSKYLARINGVDSVVDSVESIDVTGGVDRVIDLTYMFGAGNEPATAADFYKLFPTWLGYAIPYDKGSLVNFKGTGLKSVGFNQWDGTYSITGRQLLSSGSTTVNVGFSITDYIRIIPGQTYRLNCYGYSSSICWYEYNKTYISGVSYKASNIWIEQSFTAPLNAYWCRFTVLDSRENQTCFHLQWSGGRNGQYEPYWDYTRPLPTLTYFEQGMNGRGGVFDEVTQRQAVTRLAEVDMEDLEWTESSGSWTATLSGMKSNTTAIVAENGLKPVVSGTTVTIQSAESPTGKLVYELANPSVVTFPEEVNTTAQVSDYGTESVVPANGYELVTAPFLGIVKYQDNYARTITKLPENYQSQNSMDALQLVLGQLLNVTLTSRFNSDEQAYGYTVTGDGVPGLIAAALTALAPVTGLTFKGDTYMPTDGMVALPDPTIQAITTIPASTSSYTLGEGVYSHAPNSVPTYTLPDVEDATVVHMAKLTVKMSASVLTVNFRNSAGVAISYEAPTGDVRSGTLVEYLCKYEPLASGWAVAARVVMQTEPPPDEIWYTADAQVTLYSSTGVESHTFSDGKGAIKFNSDLNTVPNVLRNTAVTKIVIPGTITGIGPDAFRTCTSLTTVNMPAGLQSIGASAFHQDSNLNLDALPDTITSIGNAAFYMCAKITLSKLPSALTSIGSDAFRGCVLITISDIPLGVTGLSSNVFNGCKGITNIVFHDNIIRIDGWAFDSCVNMNTSALPANLRKIHTYAFAGCTGLTLTSLPSGVDLIESRAFSGCTNLALTSLPAGVTDLGNANAFYGCYKLALTALPPNLIRIANNTFYRCYAMHITEIPATVTTLEVQCFRDCTGLTELTFKGTPTTMESNCFQGCNKLTVIRVPWAEGAIEGAPWGATNATIIYNYTE